MKNVIKSQTIFYSNNSNGNNLTVSFKIRLWKTIEKLSLINKLKLLESSNAHQKDIVAR